MPDNPNEFSWKLFLLKYFSRAFLCSVFALGGFLYLAATWGPGEVDALWKVGMCLGVLAGVFPLHEVLGKKDGSK